MTKRIALWSGDLDLNEAFWTWTLTVGLLVNIATSILFRMLILQDQPLAAVFVGYGLSVPYNIVATVGVWRSAARYGGSVAPRGSGMHRDRHTLGQNLAAQGGGGQRREPRVQRGEDAFAWGGHDLEISHFATLVAFDPELGIIGLARWYSGKVERSSDGGHKTAFQL